MNTNTTNEREHWTSRRGFVLAAAGSAVGLGNLWKFPYITWSNEGGAFVLVYLLAIASVGLPIMLAELLVGRKAQKSLVGALQETLGPAWRWLGLFGVLTGSVVLSYYVVIAGWSLRYVITCLGWSLGDFVTEESTAAAFKTFTAQGPLQVILIVMFMGATMAVVQRGIGGGIETAARWLMPVLFIIFLLLLVSALRMEGATQALSFLLQPDFTRLPTGGVLEALGHAFFSLSLGMGTMITYGSYLAKKESIVRVSWTVVLLDTLVALSAATIMFSVIFSVPGLQEDIGRSTVGMLFITLPTLFYTVVPLGNLLAPLFYLLVAFAALTSTISLLEVPVSYCIDQRGQSRSRAVITCGLPILGVSILCGLSFGGWAPLSGFSLVYAGTPEAKFGLFEHLDHLAANLLLPLGGLFLTLGVGWAMSRQASHAELVDETTPSWFAYDLWRFFLRYVAPTAVTAILVAVALGMDFS